MGTGFTLIVCISDPKVRFFNFLSHQVLSLCKSRQFLRQFPLLGSVLFFNSISFESFTIGYLKFFVHAQCLFKVDKLKSF